MKQGSSEVIQSNHNINIMIEHLQRIKGKNKCPFIIPMVIHKGREEQT